MLYSLIVLGIITLTLYFLKLYEVGSVFFIITVINYAAIVVKYDNIYFERKQEEHNDNMKKWSKVEKEYFEK